MPKRYKYTKEQNREILLSRVKKEYRFQGYNYTQEVYDLWFSIYTGLGHKKIFDKIVNEKDIEKKGKDDQVKRLYNPSSPKLVNKAISTYSHIHRADNILNSFSLEDGLANSAVKEKSIAQGLECFYGETSAREYLSERIIYWNVYDPNSYLLVSYKQEGKKVYPYPIHIPSKQVIDREYEDGTLQYLIFRRTKKCKGYKGNVKSGDVEQKTMYEYWMITKDVIFRITVAPENADTKIDQKNKFAIDLKENRYPELKEEFGETKKAQVFFEEWPINLETIPAMCIGYVRGLPTNDLVHCDDFLFESLLYPAKSAFLESIWRKRTKDLHLSLHGIAQKFAFVPACKWKSKKDGLSCNGLGTLENQKECPSCKGSGVQSYHNDEQDIITIPIKDLTKDQYLALKDLTYYQPIDYQVIKLNVEEEEKAQREVLLAILNTPIFDSESSPQKGVEKTAYEVRANFSTMNTVLHSFSKKDEKVYKFIIKNVAGYNDVSENKINISFKYPNDFALESLTDLTLQLESMIRANGPEVGVHKLKTKIMAKLCVDDPKGFSQWNAREFWKVGKYYTNAERQSMLQLLPPTSPKKILYLFFDEIFFELEIGAFIISNNLKSPKEVKFNELPRDRQKEELDKVIEKYITAYKKDLLATQKQIE